MTLFVTFEGGEGSGKTTCLRAVATRLRDAGVPVVCHHEPGSTPLGHKIRDMLLYTPASPRDTLTPTAELLLFCAARAQFVETVLRPALTANTPTVILCDRFADSTRAYQLHARGLPWYDVHAAVSMSTQHVTPDLTVFFDVPPVVALARLPDKGRSRLDNEALAFHERVYAGYRALLAEDTTGRWWAVDATCDAAVVCEAVAETIMELWKKEKGE